MSHSNTTYLSLTKPSNQDPDTLDSWDTVVNGNMDKIDAAVGSRVYTEHNYINSTEPLGTSLDKVDMKLKDIIDGSVGPLTADQLAALAGAGVPTGANLFTTISYVAPVRKIILTPEYMGAVFHASGALNTGDMTSEMVEDASYRWNYYKWTSDEPAFNTYDISLQWVVPQTFLAWQTRGLTVDFCGSDNGTSSGLTVTLAKDGALGTTVVKTSGVVVGGTWYGDRPNNAIIHFSNTELGTTLSLGAGNIINISLRLQAKDTQNMKVGNLTFYLQC